MKFIRDDGQVFIQTYPDSIKRLKKSDRFKELEEVTVNQLKDYAKDRGLSGYSTLNREDLITLLEEGE